MRHRSLSSTGAIKKNNRATPKETVSPVPVDSPEIMSSRSAFTSFFYSIWCLFAEVFLFWRSKILSAYTRKRPKEELLDEMASAKTFEEWDVAAFRLDELLGNDLWRQDPVSKDYDYKLLYERLKGLIQAREDKDVAYLVYLLRSGLLRNLGNMCNKDLFTRSFAGTKLLIEDYNTEVVRALSTIAAQPPSPVLPPQTKLDILHDTRQAFGRSALLLQGGAIFGLCHLGVVKALYLRDLLPRIICGTAVGALIAALVGIHTDEELPRFLRGEGINLSAFAGKEKGGMKRKLNRFWKEGYLLDIKVIEECLQANVGNLTFEEAYNRTKRVLNITVTSTGKKEVPTLLNYITAPNVLIWTAACASNTSSGLYSPVELLCKDENGDIVPWAAGSREIAWKPWTTANYNDVRDSPLGRLAELFNVNHFIVSQARPYIAPFLMSDMHRHRSKGLSLKLLRLLVLEVRHRLHQLDLLGLLPVSIRRFLVDEIVPAASITVVPDLTISDFEQLLENPTKEALDYWILKGERSIWPSVGILNARCSVEFTLDRLYQVVRSNPPEGRRSPRSPSRNGSFKDSSTTPPATMNRPTSYHERSGNDAEDLDFVGGEEMKRNRAASVATIH